MGDKEKLGDLPRYYIATLSMVLLCVFIRGWIAPLTSGFFLDETGTYLMIEGSWQRYLERLTITIQSPLYLSFLWGWSRLAGLSEAALRLPSLLAMMTTAYLLYRTGSRLANPRVGLLAACALLALPRVILDGVQARPYAFCMLGATLAFWWLLDWLESPGSLASLRLALVFTALIYLQPLNAVMIAAVCASILVFCLRERRWPWRQFGILLGLPVLLCLPILPYYREAVGDAAIYSYAKRPGSAQMASIYGEDLSLGALLLGVLLAAILIRGLRLESFQVQARTIILIAIWLCVPPLLIFVYSRVSWPIFLPRYYAVSFPALALILGLFLRAISPLPAQSVVLAVFCLHNIVAMWSTDRQPATDLYRPVSQVLQTRGYPPDTPVFFATDFTEGKHLARLADPAKREFLIAPLIAYPAPGKIIALPYAPNLAEAYLEETLAANIPAHDRIIVAARSGEWHAWFAARYGSHWKIERPHDWISDMRRIPSP